MHSQHPGRVAMLRNAATATDITSSQRDYMIRTAAPGHDPEHTLAELRRYTQLLAEWRREEAEAILHALSEGAPPPEGDRA